MTGSDAAVARLVADKLSAFSKACTSDMTAIEQDASLGRLSRDLAVIFGDDSSPREFCRVALDAIVQTMPASKACVVLFGDDETEATILAHKGMDERAEGPELPRSLLNEIITTRDTLLLDDAAETHDASSVVGRGVRSVLATPMVFGGRVEGAIYLESTTLASVFREDDKTLIEAIAHLLLPYIRVGRRLAAAIDRGERLDAALEGSSSYRDFVGSSPPIKKVIETIERLKGSDVPVLIRGESGTGKELVARALHYSGRRAGAPLVVVNCAAIPEGLLESDLFGHERGAFTGATERRQGRFEQAHGGTLFLDEVAELRIDLQAKLLRVLEAQSFERVGGSRTISVDVRLVAATNKDLKHLVDRGEFREDLYYRLAVVPIDVPPLRERPEDIPLLVEHFCDRQSDRTGKGVRFDTEVIETLVQHDFPGNVRELRNLVQRLVALAPGEVVGLDELPDSLVASRRLSLDKNPFRRFHKREPRTNEELKALREEMQQLLDRHVKRVEAEFLRRLLDEADGNVSEAARRAGMNRTLFHRKLADLGND